MNKTVRTRIAPSPTGYAHLATIYQVLFDYVFARKHNGQFIVRIEDTDRARFVEGAEAFILDKIEWFKLTPDESPNKEGGFGPYRQSERLEIYRRYVDELLEKKYNNQPCAYYCFCTKERLDEMRKEQEAAHQAPMYDKRCLHLNSEEVKAKLNAGDSYVVRMNIQPDETIVVHDALVGEVEFKSELLDDQVLLKADGFPTYHLAVVVDDFLMQISHIFRGREWLPSTPKHILLYRYFGWEESLPMFVHLPLILNSEGKGKLSKRHGHASVTYYQEQGYLPEAVLNYLSLIVWKHPEGKEIYSVEELTNLFEIKDITSQGPRFDLKKLDWLNGEYIRNQVSFEDVVGRLIAGGFTVYSEEQVKRVLPMVRERMRTLSEFDWLVLFFFNEIEKGLSADLAGLENTAFGTTDDYWRSLLKPKKYTESEGAEKLQLWIDRLNGIDEWQHDELEKVGRELVEQTGWKIGELFMLVRVAVSGRTATPPLFEMLEVLGKEQTLLRLQKAKEVLTNEN